VRTRQLVALLLLAGVVPLHPASAGTRGSYHVTVIPVPQTYEAFMQSCALQVVNNVWLGRDVHRLTVRKGATFRATLAAQLGASIGDISLNWALRLYDDSGHELGRATGRPWQYPTLNVRRVPAHVQLVACNYRDHPDATITYSTS
jgi:hypothetical protein